MTSSVSVLLSFVFVACLLGGHITSAREVGVRASAGTANGRGTKVQLLRTTLRDIYARSAQMLKRELENSLAVVDSALTGDMGPAKRNGALPGTTSLGSGPLYFLAREVILDESTAEFYDTVESNNRLFDVAGK